MPIRRQTVQMRDNCNLQAVEDDTMEEFRTETMKALWQAFDTLDTAKTGLVHVSQLKVITSNVGMKMAIEKGEELLNRDGVTSMDFQTYFAIVKSELIDKYEQGEDPGKKSIGERLNSIIKTCWTFCNFERQHKSKWLSFEHCLVLWRLFNFLSETDESGEPVLPVQLHPEEASMLLKHFVDATGQLNKEQIIKESLRERSSGCLCFADFLNVFEKDCVTNLSKSDITHGLNNLQDTYLLNILGKGMLWKRGYKVKNWKERWCVMTRKEMRYYVSANERVQKGTIEFDADCSVELLPDRVGHKPNRFVIHTKKKPYEMSAPDMKTKNEWVSGLGMAFDRVGKETNIQKEAARERCMARIERKRQLEEEERRRREEAEFLRQQQGELDEERRKRQEDEELLRKRLAELEEERKLREAAEARVRGEQALKEAEMQKLREQEEINRELERLLEEERQAKRDEEIVRSLQARLLEEEFQRREELEQLKQRQEDMLRVEREQKAMLESDRLEQERVLREAQQRLEALERERAEAALKMQEATEKLQKAEKDRQIMQDKVKLWTRPVGLARTITPTANPFVTHRGQGAFCEKDFTVRGKLRSEPAPYSNYESGGSDTENTESSSIKDGTDKHNENDCDSGILMSSNEEIVDGNSDVCLREHKDSNNVTSGNMSTTQNTDTDTLDVDVANTAEIQNNLMGSNDSGETEGTQEVQAKDSSTEQNTSKENSKSSAEGNVKVDISEDEVFESHIKETESGSKKSDKDAPEDTTADVTGDVNENKMNNLDDVTSAGQMNDNAMKTSV